MKKKSVRDKGKLKFSRYFQKLKIGDYVTIIKDSSVASSFPDRLQGRTGKIEDKRGRAYVIKIKDQNKEKRFLVEPIHLKKIKYSEN